MTHISLAREAGCNPVVAGFDPQVRLQGPVAQWIELLRPKQMAGGSSPSGAAHVMLTLCRLGDGPDESRLSHQGASPPGYAKPQAPVRGSAGFHTHARLLILKRWRAGRDVGYRRFDSSRPHPWGLPFGGIPPLHGGKARCPPTRPPALEFRDGPDEGWLST